MNRWTFTSESVTEGHPDKMADQIRTRSSMPFWPRTRGRASPARRS